MVDGESQEIVSEPAGGATNRDERPEDVVVGGESAPSQATTDAEAERRARAERAGALPPVKPRVAGRAFAAGVAGGAVVAALAAAAGFYAFPMNAGPSGADANRLAALESQTSRDDAAVASLDKRLAAVEGANTVAALATIEKRVGALESSVQASAASASAAPSQTEAAQAAAPSAAQSPQAEAGTQAAQAPDAAQSGVSAALAARVAKLESVPPADLSGIAGRIDKLESALAAPKAQSRVAPEKGSATDNPAATAIVTAAIRDKLASGGAFATELTALAALGVDPANLAPLKALVEGAPTDHALEVAFKAVEPKVLAAAAPKAQGVGDRFLAHLHGLIQVHNLGESEGDDPQALVSQIVADLERGELDAALKAFAKLPEPARQAASAWSAVAQGKEAAITALRTIREAAVARLAQSGKP